MLGWQLYLGALFIKIFGFSFSIVRIANGIVRNTVGLVCYDGPSVNPNMVKLA